MSKPETMMIDDVLYVRNDSIKKENNSGPKDIRIIVLPRGWNLVGEFKRTSSGLCIINNASIIRKWGTTKGLGELAKYGPTQNTILDVCHGEVELSEINIIYTIKCEHSKW